MPTPSAEQLAKNRLYAARHRAKNADNIKLQRKAYRLRIAKDVAEQKRLHNLHFGRNASLPL